ncbi:hypothetical protein GCM10009840_18650 [Pseudolysinimonas kribbensis]|uniref:ArsR/SmtB family transcription factor n=1 Tax=Pseudolysinimonas kribbensis TaxID=433641 RepID=UPI0031DDA0B5
MHMFAMLADPVRRLLFETLATGEHAVAELTDMAMHDFGIGRTAVSHHLRTLRDEHLVITRQEGGSRMYRLHPGAMDRLEREIDALRERWEHHYGWPYLVDAPPARRPHRIDSAARRSRGPRPSWPWPERNAEEPWLDDTVEDEGDGDHRWVAEGGRPRDDPFRLD